MASSHTSPRVVSHRDVHAHEKSIQHFLSLETMDAFLQEYTKKGPADPDQAGRRVHRRRRRTVIRIGGVR